MSLIDEALKRARQDAALQDASRLTELGGTLRRDARRVAPTPWVPAHLPHRGRTGANLALLAAAVCLVAAIAATAVWWSGRKPPAPAATASLAAPATAAATHPAAASSGSAAAPQIEEQPPAAAAPATELAPAAPEANLQPPRRSREPAEPATPRQEAVAPVLPVPPVAEPPRTPPPAPAAPVAAAVAIPAGPPPALVDGKTYAREVSLPGGAKIELRGLAYSETQPVALLNGKVVGPGDVVLGFTVVHIQPSRVELAGNGLTIFLTLK